MEFEWDESKRKENLRKHGLDFRDAVTLFEGPVLSLLDSREDYGEPRWLGIGLLESICAVVAFTERNDGEIIRIIMSAKPSKKRSKTDWDEVQSQTDTDIDTSDIPPLDPEFFKSAELRMPSKKSSITVRLDSDVLKWFRNQGKGYQTRINAVLRTYMEAHGNEKT